jgi:osmoprotectant transport system permease protein
MTFRSRSYRWSLAAVALMMQATPALAAEEEVIRVGSKAFTESVVLGEMTRLLAQSAQSPAIHLRQLGGTQILWNALLAGEIDAYVEYTGTLLQEVLVKEKITSMDELNQSLRARGLRMTGTLGFNNTYAMATSQEVAKKLGLRTISDLRDHPDLVFGFGNEFMDRADGWPGLKQRYGLPQRHARGLDHDLAYRGLASGMLQLVDAYSTDAEIAYYDLFLLEDDLSFFPVYNPVILYRAELEQNEPGVVASFKRLGGLISANEMSRLNALVKIDHLPETTVAADFLREKLDLQSEAHVASAWEKFGRRTLEHLTLVFISLTAALAVSLPLGIFAARSPRVSHVILAIVGIIQTIPSLALFVFMIPLLGIGGPPAVVALFLYSLLPIVRNTHAGLTNIPRSITESALVLGMSGGSRLWLVELPLAASTILAGIKTAAVINVGTATLAALIGAGGYGQPILTGIRLDNTSLILQGAIPAAALALLVQGLFELAERKVVPRGLKSS